MCQVPECNDPHLGGKRDLRVCFRLADEGDVEETYRIMLRANEDLNRRLGRPVQLEEHSPSARALAVRRNGLRHDPERFWVAECEGLMIGFGLAIWRRSFWYLAALHILPEFQSRGIGSELIRRCAGDPSTRPPWFLTISESINLAATGLYGRYGMFPQVPIVHLEGPARSLGCSGVRLRRVDGNSAQAEFGRLDRSVLGEIRPEDHECWSCVPDLTPYIVQEGGQSVGYIYIDRGGALGPAAIERPELLCPTISAALESLVQSAPQVARIRVAGTARESLAALLSAGFRLDTGINLFLTSRQFGRLEQYLFSGADALF